MEDQIGLGTLQRHERQYRQTLDQIATLPIDHA
jgi:hypothetical protein